MTWEDVPSWERVNAPSFASDARRCHHAIKTFMALPRWKRCANFAGPHQRFCFMHDKPKYRKDDGQWVLQAMIYAAGQFGGKGRTGNG